ncbi:uncharacterized protein LOC108211520 isoform X2 [Daucus carota subsp. sativus]|uniref:uncharacterized protein LOC108211520 isoform X2 n=1 Tax=Daucus carota subsp. sativus TaxID=79200 RepID=UPI0007EFA4AA|nr:PREDICTED: serine/threonine-protein kinase 19 isoform X2 [Daucus carota subsp. sativus]
MEKPSSTSPSSPRKRRRIGEQSDPSAQSDSLELNFSFSDTLVALQMMRSQFPSNPKILVKPFVLQSQLYSSVKDRTQVDRELEIKCVAERMKAKKQDDLAIFEWFKLHVVHSKLDPSIEHEELCSLLSLGGKVKDEHLTVLINAGLLARQLVDPNMYWFTIPNIGSLLKSLSQGRQELLSFLKRRRYKEMMMATLEKKSLRFSPLDIRFHLRDLIGSGSLKTSQTPSGLVVQIAKD